MASCSQSQALTMDYCFKKRNFIALVSMFSAWRQKHLPWVAAQQLQSVHVKESRKLVVYNQLRCLTYPVALCEPAYECYYTLPST